MSNPNAPKPPPFEGRLELAASFLTGMISNPTFDIANMTHEETRQIVLQCLRLADELARANDAA